MNNKEKISPEQVEHIADLARIELRRGDREKFSEELGGIFDYINQLQNIDTDGIDPAFQITPLFNVMRDDIPAESLSPHDALANAPATESGYFKLPRILSRENPG